MGTVGPPHPVEPDRYGHIAAAIRMRSGDARIEEHHAIARLIRLRLLVDKIRPDDRGYRDALLRINEFANDDHKRIVGGRPLRGLGEMDVMDAKREGHLVPL